MERGFYNEDIEELLKEKADQYKMYPSDKVWKGIHRSLHPNRKWYWLSLFLFLSAVGYYTFIEFIAPGNAGKPANGSAPSSTASKPTTENNDNEPRAVIIPFGNPSKQATGTGSNKPRNFVLNPDNTGNNNAGNAGIIANFNTLNTPVTAPEMANAEAIAMANGSSSEAPVYDITTGRLQHAWQPAPVQDEALPLTENNTRQQLAGIAAANTSLAHATPVDAATLGSHTQNEQEDAKRANWLHQVAVYELQVPKAKRLSWQLAFTPTMNYRTLKGSNNASDVKTLPLAPVIEGDPEKLVNHKPALGFELGSNLLYTINKTFTFKTGLQFNYIRYDIQAYSSYASERAVIALNTAYGIGTNAITTYTRYRNFGGDAVQNLHNQFFQLALPIGLEVNLLGNEKIQVGVAGTLQPTYLLNRNTYLLTSDYKYTTEPSLVRRWNLNTSAEAFISYKMGDLKWQVGPQFRYQLLSNYVKEYPIREHLMEYGIQIGVSKTIR
jgi:hypothetical protein